MEARGLARADRFSLPASAESAEPMGEGQGGVFPRPFVDFRAALHSRSPAGLGGICTLSLANSGWGRRAEAVKKLNRPFNEPFLLSRSDRGDKPDTKCLVVVAMVNPSWRDGGKAAKSAGFQRPFRTWGFLVPGPRHFVPG
jgi:hypothetical protein